MKHLSSIHLYIAFYYLLNCIFMDSVSGQNFCNTTGGPNSLSVLPQGVDLQPGPFTIKVYMHIIRRSNGSDGITLTQLEESKHYLDEAFNPHEIYFGYACDVIYIDSDSLYFAPVEKWCALRNVSSHSDGIDIYIGGDDSAPGGNAANIPSYGFSIGGTSFGKVYSRSYVMAHEMGHCLGLWHTHHGTASEVFTDCNGNTSTDPNECSECVDQSNSDICGDYILDTPADNNINHRVNPSSCFFLGSDVDPCDNVSVYAPSVINIMGYTLPGCMNEFTVKQGERMRAMILLDAGLSARLLPETLNSITHIYSTTTFDFSMTMPGDIIVHTGAELNIVGCTIKMPWKSKIIVERGAVLLTSNSTLTRACGAPHWQGIFVEGNASLEQPEIYDIPANDRAGSVLIVNGSTVEWARTAISASKPGGYFGDYFGGLVYANNSQFI